jgi:hypothetical protein
MRIDAKDIVSRAMDNPLGWTDYDREMGEETRRQYALNARLILENEVWKNESKRLVDTMVKHIACQSVNFDSVLDLRMTINAVVLMQERLQEIANWHKIEEKAEDEFDGI